MPRPLIQPKMTHIESRAAATVLQKPLTLKLGGRQYTVAPPTLATLILVSEAAAQLPPDRPDPDRVLEETLRLARDCRPLGDIAAILILGGRRLRTRLGRWRARRLARRLLDTCSPRELHAGLAQVFKQMEVGDFFGLTTFLIEINLTRPTKVVTTPTASGQ